MPKHPKTTQTESKLNALVLETRFMKRLSEREVEVAALLAGDASHKVIADQLGISPKTVANHSVNIYRKLGIHTMCQLTHWAIAHGLVKARAEWGKRN
jgi:DNA-binding NarL/FixJ family response regulator